MAVYKPNTITKGPTWTIDNKTDSSEWNEILPNSLSFKNITNTTQAQKELTFYNNRLSNPMFVGPCIIVIVEE